MQMSLSAGGSPETVKERLKFQVKQQLGEDPSPAKTAAAATVLDYVADELDEVPADASVSVSVSLYVSITKPVPLPEPVSESEPAAAQPGGPGPFTF